MRLVEAVLATYQSGQHPRIGRVRLAGDDGDAQAGLAAHGEPAEHLDMRVPSPEQDEIGRDRGARLH